MLYRTSFNSRLLTFSHKGYFLLNKFHLPIKSTLGFFIILPILKLKEHLALFKTFYQFGFRLFSNSRLTIENRPSFSNVYFVQSATFYSLCRFFLNYKINQNNRFMFSSVLLSNNYCTLPFFSKILLNTVSCPVFFLLLSINRLPVFLNANIASITRLLTYTQNKN